MYSSKLHELLILSYSFDGETPLSNAAKAGNFETVQYLLDLSSVTAMNVSILVFVSKYRCHGIVFLFIPELCTLNGSYARPYQMCEDSPSKRSICQ